MLLNPLGQQGVIFRGNFSVVHRNLLLLYCSYFPVCWSGSSLRIQSFVIAYCIPASGALPSGVLGAQKILKGVHLLFVLSITFVPLICGPHSSISDSLVDFSIWKFC